MTRFRSLCLFLGFVAFAGVFAFVARRLYAGPERIAISCGTSNFVCGPVVVPVTVSMASDGPDYVDMTYTATDGSGNPVSCSPSSNRLYVSKGSPVTDNVSVACTTNTNFSVLGTGETGGDTGACGFTIVCTGCGPDAKPMSLKPAAKTKTATATTSTTSVVFAGDTKNWVWVVPLEIQLLASNDQVQLTYTATATTKNGTAEVPITTPITCVPAAEMVNLDSRVAPYVDVQSTQANGLLMRHVAVRAQSEMATLTLNVNAQGLKTPLAQWSLIMPHASTSLPPGPQNAGPAIGTGNLSIGANPNTGPRTGLPNGSPRSMIKFVEHVVQLNLSLAPTDSLFLKFQAQDSNSQALHCYPSHSHLVYNPALGTQPTGPAGYPIPYFVLVKGKGMSGQGTFTVFGDIETTNPKTATGLSIPPTKTLIEIPYTFTK
jgi:hypothetical protein